MNMEWVGPFSEVDNIVKLPGERHFCSLAGNLPEAADGRRTRHAQTGHLFVANLLVRDEVLKMVEASGANVLLVGLGAPKQEIWISNFRDRLPRIRVMMGVGATIDYEAGAVKRAPVLLRRMGLEWTYRVATEPQRYLMRYARSSKFLWWMLMDRLGRYKDPFGSAQVPLAR